jgi:hypothetical protein
MPIRTMLPVPIGQRYPVNGTNPIQFRETELPIRSRSEDRGFNAVTNRLGRDLPLDIHNRHIVQSFYLFRTNPLAKRLINMYVDFIIGEGVEPLSSDENTNTVLQEYWRDPYNKWNTRLHRRIRDLLIYGEWFHHPVVGPQGRVWMNTFQPDKIREAVPAPFNHEIITHLVIRTVQAEKVVDQQVEIIRPDFNAQTGLLAGYVGQVFLHGINGTTDATRGVGELFPLIDYIDVYDEMLFNRAEKIATSSAIWWDLMLEGFTDQQITDYLARDVTLPPKPGTVWGHNERAELKLMSPETHADQHAEDVKTQKSHIVSSAGFPGTWFDEPGDAGRAVGAEMAEPTYKAVLSMQKQIAGFLREEMNFVLWHAERAKRFGAAWTPGEFVLQFPRPAARDIQRIGPAVFRLSQSLGVAAEHGMLTNEQGAIVLTSQLNALGLSEIPLTPEPFDVAPPAPQQSPSQSDEDDQEDDDEDEQGDEDPDSQSRI